MILDIWSVKLDIYRIMNGILKTIEISTRDLLPSHLSR